MSGITLMAIFKKLFGGEKAKKKYDGTVVITKKEEE